MSKTKARLRAKTKSPKKTRPKGDDAQQGAAERPGRFDAGTGSIRGSHQSATIKNFAGAKANAARSR